MFVLLVFPCVYVVVPVQRGSGHEGGSGVSERVVNQVCEGLVAHNCLALTLLCVSVNVSLCVFGSSSLN